MTIRRLGNFTFVALSALMLTLILLTTLPPQLQGNLHGQQAIAFLSGKLNIIPSQATVGQDYAEYRSQFYSPFPPAPALLMIPFIALSGASLPMAVIVVPMVLATTLMFRKVIQNWAGNIKQYKLNSTWWLSALILGTGYTGCVLLSRQVWYLSQVTSVFFLTLALFGIFCVQKRSVIVGLLVGVGLGGAFLSRQVSIMFVPLFLYWIIQKTNKPVMASVSCIVIIALCVIGYSLLNAARFGSAIDTGYTYIVIDKNDFTAIRVAEYGLFSWRYIPFNLAYFFLHGLTFEFNSPDLLRVVSNSTMGTGLLIASPFVISALYARRPRAELLFIWGTIIIIFGTHITYYNNGYAQLNAQRFTLDYLPVLLLLAVTGSQRLPPGLMKGFIIWALLLNAVMVWVYLANAI